MGSIPKIVSTPVKWVSKRIIQHTLLRFPGGDSHDPIACTYCPEMCRFACPTAVVSANDAVTPCNKNSLLYKEQKWPGQSAQGGPLWTLYDCTGCGRCTEYCVYGMPVAEKLFEARQKHSWDRALEVARNLTDEEDPTGDLAFELGDAENSRRRIEKTLSERGSDDLSFDEPREVVFAKKSGYVSARLSWKKRLLEALPGALNDALTESVMEQLRGKKWLLHESPWLSRHLDQASQVKRWIAQVQNAGVEIVIPFENGRDCIDCGGEGAYDRLFPAQAMQMAREIWERDCARVDSVLTMSRRCQKHFEKVLGASIEVRCLIDVFMMVDG